jgi:hypothetical protein
MMPHCRPHSSNGFHGVRLHHSGLLGGRDHASRRPLWFDTFDTLELTARVFDALVWWLDDPRSPLNFPEVQSREKAEFLAPPFEVVRRDKDRAVRREYM